MHHRLTSGDVFFKSWIIDIDIVQWLRIRDCTNSGSWERAFHVNQIRISEIISNENPVQNNKRTEESGAFARVVFSYAVISIKNYFPLIRLLFVVTQHAYDTVYRSPTPSRLDFLCRRQSPLLSKSVGAYDGRIDRAKISILFLFHSWRWRPIAEFATVIGSFQSSLSSSSSPTSMPTESKFKIEIVDSESTRLHFGLISHHAIDWLLDRSFSSRSSDCQLISNRSPPHHQAVLPSLLENGFQDIDPEHASSRIHTNPLNTHTLRTIGGTAEWLWSLRSIGHACSHIHNRCSGSVYGVTTVSSSAYSRALLCTQRRLVGRKQMWKEDVGCFSVFVVVEVCLSCCCFSMFQ